MFISCYYDTARKCIQIKDIKILEAWLINCCTGVNMLCYTQNNTMTPQDGALSILQPEYSTQTQDIVIIELYSG